MTKPHLVTSNVRGLNGFGKEGQFSDINTTKKGLSIICKKRTGILKYNNNSLFTINHPQRTNKTNNNTLTTKIHEKL